MTSRVLIPAVMRQLAATQPYIRFSSHPHGSKFFGAKYYSVHSKKNGEVVLTEYKNKREFLARQKHILTLARKFHALNAPIGCDCGCGDAA